MTASMDLHIAAEDPAGCMSALKPTGLEGVTADRSLMPTRSRRGPKLFVQRNRTVIPQHRILIVSRDVSLVALCSKALAVTGSIIPVAATTLKAAENAALDRKATIGAMLLDTTLDKDNARALCARLRQSGARMPIILLSASQDESDIVQGLEAGADDYVFKPPQPAELAARVRALMRAYGDNVQAPLRIGPQDFLPAVRILRHRRTQRITHLTAKEAALLQFLHMVRGDLVARTTLEREIWGYSPGVRTNTVVTHVHRLRTKIELDPAHPTFLLRERGFYRFCVDEPEIRQSASVNTAILDDPWHKSSAGAPPAEEWIGVAKQCA